MARKRKQKENPTPAKENSRSMRSNSNQNTNLNVLQVLDSNSNSKRPKISALESQDVSSESGNDHSEKVGRGVSCEDNVSSVSLTQLKEEKEKLLLQLEMAEIRRKIADCELSQQPNDESNKQKELSQGSESTWVLLHCIYDICIS